MGGGVGTLGLPRGLPSDDIASLTPQFESGEPGITGQAVPDSNLQPKVRWATREMVRAEPHVLAWREQANDCYRFRDGHQLSSEDAQILRANKRPNTAFNEIQKFLKFVSGIERRTQQALLFLPRNADDQEAQIRGEWKTKLYEWFCDQSKAQYARSRAFEDKIVGGLGFVDIGVTRVTNPHGAPRYTRIPPTQMLWPECDNENLDGVKWLARENYMDVVEAVQKWPNSSVFLRAAAGGAANEDQFPDFGRGAGRPIQYVVPWIMTEPLNKNGGGMTGKPGKVPICEFQFYEDDPGYYFFDPLEKEDTWLSESDFRKYKTRLALMFDAEITDFDPTVKRVYKRMFLLQRRVLLEAPKPLPTNGENPSFTFIGMTGTWDPDEHCFYGLTRVLMDPQRYANAFFRQVLEVMGASTKGGYLAESGAITPAQKHDIEQSGSRPGSINIVQPDAIRTQRIMPKPIPQLPSGSLAVLQFCIDAIEKVAGISTQMMGSEVQGAVPGVSLRRQLTSGMVLLAAEFDSLSLFRQREGYVVADFLKLIADDRLVRIGGAFDAQSIQLKRNLFDEYDDIILDENDQDPNLRQLYTDSILQIAPMLVRTGNFFPELLDYLNLPVAIRKKLKEGMEQNKKQQMDMMMQGIGQPGRGKPRSIDEIKSQVQLTQARAQRARREGRNCCKVRPVIRGCKRKPHRRASAATT